MDLKFYTEKESFVCTNDFCKSENVLKMCWVNPNTNEIDSMLYGTENLVEYCKDCNDETKIDNQLLREYSLALKDEERWGVFVNQIELDEKYLFQFEPYNDSKALHHLYYRRL